MTTLNSAFSQINSTIVRSLSAAALATTRSYFGLLSRLRPNLARRQAERRFTTPPRHALAYPAPAAARRETVLSAAGHVALWQAGPAAAPAVLLVHGWGGVGAQLGGFVAPLLARGFRVVWFDLPGHGESGRRPVALPDAVAAIDAIAAACGPFHAAIGHSLGGAATALALRGGLALQRAVFIAAPISLGDHLRHFARALGITPQVRDAVRRRIETRYARTFAEIDRVEALRAHRLPTLLVHDRADPAVPFAAAERLAACLPQAHLIATEGLGHARILREPAVIGAIAAFVAGTAGRLPETLPELPNPAPLY